ncbi:MAG TPA: thiamine phosphate synthase [Candidatus Methylomirabilis sp.]|nr:thiamine phosphate synthase [Candidatus Methylomirabilis sp.]
MSLTNSASPDSGRNPRLKPVLCYVTDRLGWAAPSEAACKEKLLDRIEALSAAGIDWIQLREKDLSARALSDLTCSALHRVARHPPSEQAHTRLMVNDRLDAALAERAGGVHLGEQSLPVAEARRLLLARQSLSTKASDFLLGVSCHSLDQAKAAATSGANYIFFGPVFVTPSKTKYGPPQGVDRLHEVCSSVPIPVLAIGGITLETAPSCFAAGASGIASVRLFQDAPDPAAVIRNLLS